MYCNIQRLHCLIQHRHQQTQQHPTNSVSVNEITVNVKHSHFSAMVTSVLTVGLLTTEAHSLRSQVSHPIWGFLRKICKDFEREPIFSKPATYTLI